MVLVLNAVAVLHGSATMRQSFEDVAAVYELAKAEHEAGCNPRLGVAWRFFEDAGLAGGGVFLQAVDFENVFGNGLPGCRGGANWGGVPHSDSGV
jgi:hypothetical protein